MSKFYAVVRVPVNDPFDLPMRLCRRMSPDYVPITIDQVQSDLGDDRYMELLDRYGSAVSIESKE